MCGRYELLGDNGTEVKKILEIVNSKYTKSIEIKTGEIFPTNTVPILAIQGKNVEIVPMKWGFPKWDGKGVIINARSETVESKKMFSESFALRRCVVLATGFFEWGYDAPKRKYLFRSKDTPMLYMAGFYSQAADETNFTILTRAANSAVNAIHSRMPVILYKDELVKWLADYDFAKSIINRDDVELVCKETD